MVWWFDGGHHFGWVSKSIRSWQHRNRFVDAQGRLRSWELISDWLKERVVFQEGKVHEILNLLEYIDFLCIYIYSTYSILVWYWYSWSMMIDNRHFLQFIIWYKVKCMVYTSLRMSLAYSIIQHHIIISVLSYWYNTCTCIFIYMYIQSCSMPYLISFIRFIYIHHYTIIYMYRYWYIMCIWHILLSII